jgi:phenylpyruvate tautomerase PptA (4-oxalocrotonate tautomerase family)
MPWINLTIRKGALPKETQHAVMAKLTEVLTFRTRHAHAAS